MNIKELLDAYTIEIPALQRNYVHGEDTARSKEVREHFLAEFCRVVHGGENEKFDLNFIYGTIEGDIFIPVDGQQRLTTLWLLATFLVHRNPGGAVDEVKKEWIERLGKFKYAGRPLAEIAAKSLSKGATPDQLKKSGLSRDATCAAMIGTLDTIAEFKLNCDDFRALDNALERVIFEFQEIAQDSEETYIKMNARGKTLTQWENFKGKFSELLDVNTKQSWDKQIEKFTDQFIELHDEKENLENVLPDAPFFALIGRMLFHEAEKSLLEKTKTNWKREKKDLRKDFEQKVPNLVALVSYSFENNDNRVLPYVPFEEFKMAMEVDSEQSNLKLDIGKVSENILKFIGWIIETRSNPGLVYPYWEKGGRSLWEVVFRPQNERERDLGLVLYEYSKHFVKNNELAMDKLELALRLVANIVENDDGDRLEHCVRFFCNGEALYGKEACEDNVEAWQVAEEMQKGRIYSLGNQELTLAMQRMECNLKGRVRMAILDLSKKAHESLLDMCVLDNTSKMQRRMARLEDLLNYWKKQSNDDERSDMFFDKIIPQFEWGDPFEIDLNFKTDGLSDLLRSPNDKFLQKTLIDGFPSAGYLEDDAKTFGKDWRKVLQAKCLRCVFRRGIKIRWHYATERYYLYTGSQVRWAYPISDYRIDLLWNDDLCKAFWGKCPNEMDERMRKGQINDAGTISRRLENRLHVYLYADGIVIKAYGEDGKNLQEAKKPVENQDISWMPEFLSKLQNLKYDNFVANGIENL